MDIADGAPPLPNDQPRARGRSRGRVRSVENWALGVESSMLERGGGKRCSPAALSSKDHTQRCTVRFDGTKHKRGWVSNVHRVYSLEVLSVKLR